MTADCPLVTVLVPTYNRADYLNYALRSALKQSYSNIEVIVLDDASSDNTPAMVAALAGDSRLRSMRHEKNLGIVQNWRIGIGAAKGDFFCLLHDDDTIETRFVETLVQPLIEDENLALSFCDHWVMDGCMNRSEAATNQVGRRFGRDLLQPGVLPDFAYAALVKDSLPVGATLFRRALITPDLLAEEAKGAIDAWLFYQCVKTGCRAFYCPQRLMNYRQHSEGMSGSMPMYMAEGHVYRYRHILADSAMKALHAPIRRKLAAALADVGIRWLVLGDDQAARRLLRQSLCLRMSFRGMVFFGLACAGGTGSKTAAALRGQS